VLRLGELSVVLDGDLKPLEGAIIEGKAIAKRGGDQAGRQFGDGFNTHSGRIGKTSAAGIAASLGQSLPAAAGPLAIGFGLAFAASLAPAIASAVSVGAGLGVIGLGALLVKEQPAVKAAGGSLVSTLKSTFTTAAEPLVGPFVGALGILRQLIVAIGPNLRTMFTSVGPAVTQLATGLSGLVTSAMPGIMQLVTAAGPGLAALAAALPGLGADLSAAFSTIAAGAPAGASILAGIIGTAGDAIRMLGETIGWLAKHRDVVVPLTAALGVISGTVLTIVAAMKIWTAVNAAYTAVQWLLNLSMWSCPLTWIVLAIIAVVAIFVVLWVKCEGFRNFWKATWDVIWSAIKFVWDWVSQNWPLLLAILTGPIGLAVLAITSHWDAIKTGAMSVYNWIVEKFNAIVGFVTGLPGRIAAAASSMWDGITAAFRSAVNWIIDKWNHLSLTIGGGTIMGVDIPSVTLSTPDIPRLASGGSITAGGAAWIAERGPELVTLPRGASVTPLTDSYTNRSGIDSERLAGLVGAALREAIDTIQQGDVNVIVDGEIVERRALAAMRRNPQAVALANRTGSRRLSYAGTS
jgi:phage-related protein